jgi:hypothetical protein
VVILSHKPLMGELELKLDKNPRNIIYVKIRLTTSTSRQLKLNGDIAVTLESTQIIRHQVQILDEISVGAEWDNLDLRNVVNVLIND